MIRAARRALPFLPPPPPRVPLVRLEGVIARGGGRLARGLSLAGVEDALDRAFRMPGAPAVALIVNSPGGSAVQSRLIHDRVRLLAKKHGKAVLAFCEDLAASGGYMLALAGDEIWADPSSIVGSIGIVGATFGAHHALARFGIERRVYTAGAHKVRLDPFKPENPDDVAWVKKLQADLHAEFIALVRERRAGKLVESAEPLYEGDVWLGRRAVELGLVDGLGNAREVLIARYGEDLKFRTISTFRPPLLARLLGGGADALVGAVEERAEWGRYGL